MASFVAPPTAPAPATRGRNFSDFVDRSNFNAPPEDTSTPTFGLDKVHAIRAAPHQSLMHQDGFDLIENSKVHVSVDSVRPVDNATPVVEGSRFSVHHYDQPFGFLDEFFPRIPQTKIPGGIGNYVAGKSKAKINEELEIYHARDPGNGGGAAPWATALLSQYGVTAGGSGPAAAATATAVAASSSSSSSTSGGGAEPKVRGPRSASVPAPRPSQPVGFGSSAPKVAPAYPDSKDTDPRTPSHRTDDDGFTSKPRIPRTQSPMPRMSFEDDDDAPPKTSRSKTPRGKVDHDDDADSQRQDQTMAKWEAVHPTINKLQSLVGDSDRLEGTIREQADDFMKTHNFPIPNKAIKLTSTYMKAAKEHMEQSWTAGKGKFTALIERSRGETTSPRAERKRSVSTHPRDKGGKADNFDTAVERIIAEQGARSESRRSRI